MQKSRWIIASSSIALAMGFGHAGCYTSGIPGGPAAGGAPTMSTGGQTSHDAGNDSETGGVDAGSGGTSAGDSFIGSKCINALQCGDIDVCNEQTSTCVECNATVDCKKRGGVCDTSTNKCVGCLQDSDCGQDNRCAASRCIAAASCGSANDCKPFFQVCDAFNGYCVECTRSDDCIVSAVDKCADGPCTCYDGLCFAPGTAPGPSTDAG